MKKHYATKNQLNQMILNEEKKFFVYFYTSKRGLYAL